MNPFAQSLTMFQERVNILALVKGATDEMGGPTELDPVLVLGDEPAYIEDLNVMDVAALHAQGLTVNTFVFVARNPGDLLEGSVVQVLRRAGIVFPNTDLDPAPRYRVQRVMTSSIGPTVVWRIECQART